MSVELSTILMLGLMVLLIVAGLPVVFALGTVAIVFSLLNIGEQALVMLPLAILKTGSNSLLTAVPLFVFMAGVLEHSGIAEDMFKAMRVWMGNLKGGLLMGTVIICTVMAAMTGTSGAGTLTMGTVSLPVLKKLKYDQSLSIGAVAAGGVLGILIPPSIIMIIYASVAGESVGKLFAGGVFPGLLLAALYVIYIGLRCRLNPALGPPLPREEIPGLKERVFSLRGVILPILLVVLVLGVIYSGTATPTESASFGAAGALVCAAIHRRLDWQVVKMASLAAFKLTVMALYLYAAAVCFNQTFQFIGGADLVRRVTLALPVGSWGILIGMMLILFALGCFMDDYAIVLLCAPIFLPIVQSLGFDLLWFGLLFMVNMQMAYLTPPYGFNLFYMRALLPEEVSMADIYKSVAPFVGLQAVGLALCLIFPPILTWLPNALFH